MYTKNQEPCRGHWQIAANMSTSRMNLRKMRLDRSVSAVPSAYMLNDFTSGRDPL